MTKTKAEKPISREKLTRESLQQRCQDVIAFLEQADQHLAKGERRLAQLASDDAGKTMHQLQKRVPRCP